MPAALAPLIQDATLEDACGPEGARGVLCRLVFEATGSESAARSFDTLAPLVRVLIILTIAWFVNRVVRLAIRRVVRRLEADTTRARLDRFKRRTGLSALETTASTSPVRRAQRAETIGAGLRSIASIVIWLIAVVMILATLAIDVGPLLAGAGLIGIVVGFGAQQVVGDFLAGMFMIFEDQFGVGDIIDTGFAVGTVEHVSLRVTRIRDVDGVVWHVPNGMMQRVGNHSQEWSRALLDVDVAYDTDLDLARRVILETAQELARDERFRDLVLAEPDLWGVQDFTADAITIRLVVKTKPLEQWAVGRELRYRLKRAFDRHGIEIPFPQRTVWVRGAGHSVPLDPEDPDGAEGSPPLGGGPDEPHRPEQAP